MYQFSVAKISLQNIFFWLPYLLPYLFGYFPELSTSCWDSSVGYCFLLVCAVLRVVLGGGVQICTTSWREPWPRVTRACTAVSLQVSTHTHTRTHTQFMGPGKYLNISDRDGLICAAPRVSTQPSLQSAEQTLHLHSTHSPIHSSRFQSTPHHSRHKTDEVNFRELWCRLWSTAIYHSIVYISGSWSNFWCDMFKFFLIQELTFHGGYQNYRCYTSNIKSLSIYWQG